MARYESSPQNVEPALAWSMALFMGVIALWGRVVFTSYEYTPDRVLPAALQALAGCYALLGAGLAGAMGEPLPSDPREGDVPLRLRFCWGILGWTLPPGRGVRRVGALAAPLLYLYPFDGLGPYSLAAAAAVFLGGQSLRKPKDVLAMDFGEWLYLLGLAALGLGALYHSSGDTAAESWRGVATLAAVLLLAGQRAREVCALRWAQVLPGLPPPPALDLSRYELSVEREGPAEPVALAPGAEEQLVDTGSFRVDAGKMLDKLRSYQLTDPRDFICAWLRCAAASGAKEMRLQSSLTGLELAFDGRAFTAAQLAQPYQALVDDEGADGKRNRHFAYGLLGLYRLRPRSVSVTSRGPSGVAAMSAGAGKPPDPALAPEGTVIRVDWPAWALFWRPYLLVIRAWERYGLGPAALTVNGKAVKDSPAVPGWQAAERKGWRICRFGAGGGRGRVRVYVLGTLIEVLGPEDAEVDAWLSHDELELDISQSSVVRGKRLDAGLDLLGPGRSV